MHNSKNEERGTKNFWGKGVEVVRKKVGKTVHECASFAQKFWASERLVKTMQSMRRFYLTAPQGFTHTSFPIKDVPSGLYTLSPGLIIVIVKENILL